MLIDLSKHHVEVIYEIAPTSVLIRGLQADGVISSCHYDSQEIPFTEEPSEVRPDAVFEGEDRSLWREWKCRRYGSYYVETAYIEPLQPLAISPVTKKRTCQILVSTSLRVHVILDMAQDPGEWHHFTCHAPNFNPESMDVPPVPSKSLWERIEED